MNGKNFCYPKFLFLLVVMFIFSLMKRVVIVVVRI